MTASELRKSTRVKGVFAVDGNPKTDEVFIFETRRRGKWKPLKSPGVEPFYVDRAVADKALRHWIESRADDLKEKRR